MTKSNGFVMSNAEINMSLYITTTCTTTIININDYDKQTWQGVKYKSCGTRWRPATKPTNFTEAFMDYKQGFITASNLRSSGLEQELGGFLSRFYSNTCRPFMVMVKVERLATDCCCLMLSSITELVILIFSHSLHSWHITMLQGMRLNLIILRCQDNGDT